MIPRLVRGLVHLGGWLLTPIASVLGAALGATIMLLVAPALSPRNALILAVLGGLIGAAAGLWLWLRFIRVSPVLQDVLAVTPEGVPTEDALDEVIGKDSPEKESSQ